MSHQESFYWKKFGQREPLTDLRAHGDLRLCITIPAHREPGTLLTLQSLASCAGFDNRVEVLVLFNASEADSKARELNEQGFEECLAWVESHDLHNISVYNLSDLPGKHAGVGLARKILMDEASLRFEMLGHDGLIVCLDADCVVSQNYIQTMLFAERQDIVGASIRFEHPLDQLEEQHVDAIMAYETHLRYYLECMRFVGFPHAYHTVGSSMMVRSSVYQAQGGMNRRKAGEDFYFLNKIIAAGKFVELNECCVYPSPRSSDRVPFGTGKAVGDSLDSKALFPTYDFRNFIDLKALFDRVDELYLSNYNGVIGPMRDFLDQLGFESRVEEMRSNVGSKEAFVKRFFRWFDAFVIMKYAHYMRDHHCANGEVVEQSNRLFEELGMPATNDLRSTLMQLRERQAAGWS